MTAHGFGMGFFGKNLFDKDARKKFKEEWFKMSDSEKLEFMNNKMNAFDNHEDPFSIENIDARCEKWMKMTPEEKETFVKERKQAFESRMHGMGGPFGRMCQ